MIETTERVFEEFYGFVAQLLVAPKIKPHHKNTILDELQRVEAQYKALKIRGMIAEYAFVYIHRRGCPSIGKILSECYVADCIPGCEAKCSVSIVSKVQDLEIAYPFDDEYSKQLEERRLRKNTAARNRNKLIVNLGN